MSEIVDIEFDKDPTWYRPCPTYPRDTSGWWGIPDIMPALLKRFSVDRKSVLEFGVEYFYSGACLSQLFNSYIGVDWFVGDGHSGPREDYSSIAVQNAKPFTNAKIFKSSYQDWIAKDLNKYDLIHVDVIHTFEATYELGKWSIDRSPVVILHDTCHIWPQVKQAISQVADESGAKFYNYPHCSGLGILVR